MKNLKIPDGRKRSQRSGNTWRSESGRPAAARVSCRDEVCEDVDGDRDDDHEGGVGVTS